MTKNDTDFNGWFDQLRDNLADQGISFNDPDSVRDDYDDGKCLFDVMDGIIDERS